MEFGKSVASRAGNSKRLGKYIRICNTTLVSFTILLFCGFSEMNRSGNIEAATLPVIPNREFVITTYGAVASSSIDNTIEIQKTIDTCSSSGGGIVIIPTGVFLCGPVIMKSNVNLRISEGAILRILPYGNGSGIDPGIYPNTGTSDSYSNFIYGKKLTNIEISGSGIIDGQGAAWWAAFDSIKTIIRPCMLAFEACTNVAILGITMQNAPNVHIGIGKGSSNVTISSVTINSPSNSPNTDGIDIWCPNVDITGCNIACGDDNIALDATSSNIKIKHCNFGVGHGCSIGSYAIGIDSVFVDSCTFNGTSSGIRLKSNRGRGGVEQNIIYSNISMTGVQYPVYISSYYPHEPSAPSLDSVQPITDMTPSWKNITLKNITVSGSTNAGIIWGLPELSISNVVFDNVKISATKGMKAFNVTGLVFKNGSSITVTSGNAVTKYNASVAGIDTVTGKPIAVSTSHYTNANPVISGNRNKSEHRIFNAEGRLLNNVSNCNASGLRISATNSKKTVIVIR